MKLKTKLIISFGTVVLSIFLIFAEITRYTFWESLRKSNVEILQLKSQQIAFKTKAAFELSFKPLLASLRPMTASNLLSHDRENIDLDKELTTFVQNTALYSELSLIAIHQNQIMAKTSPEGKSRSFEKILESLAQNKIGISDASFIKDQAEMFLVWPLTLNDKALFDYIIIAKLDLEVLKEQTLSYLNIPDSELFIGQNDDHMLESADFSEAKNLSEDDIHEILAMKVENHTLTSFKNFFLYSSPPDFFGWHLNLIIPTAHLTKNLIRLKNRIIVALVIIVWVSIWVILILAYKISNPIQQLSQITKDIISFNYTTEFKFKPGNDEIGELSKNFEIMRLKIKNLIAKDPLTNTYNRRFLMHTFELALLKAIRLEETLSLIILDIDNFKMVNDTYGHQCGDEVLKVLGEILLSSIRNYDTAARYGGEEFVVLLPNTDIHIAHLIAERIRKSTAERSIQWEGKTLQCTLSLGIARFDAEYANTTEDILNLADKALYEAKRGGKNQTRIYTKKMKACHICATADDEAA